MKVYIDKERKTVEIQAHTVKELLVQLHLNPTTVLVARDNILLTSETMLQNTDEIKIFSVISGG